MSEGTRSAIFGLFVVAGQALTASQVIALAAPIGITATNAKSHLTRMVADGSLIRTGKARLARYRPSAKQQDVVAGIQDRLVQSDQTPWNGDWVILVCEGPADKEDRDAYYAALWFDGFRPIAPATFARPAWPADWALRQAKHHCFAGGLTFNARPVGLNRHALNELYELDALDAQARCLAEELSQLGSDLTPERAFAVRHLAGGDVARFMGHDPRLPMEMWGRRTGLQRLRTAWHRLEARTAAPAREFLSQVLQEHVTISTGTKNQ